MINRKPFWISGLMLLAMVLQEFDAQKKVQKTAAQEEVQKTADEIADEIVWAKCKEKYEVIHDANRCFFGWSEDLLILKAPTKPKPRD